MIHHLVLLELAEGTGDNTIEWIMRETRARLLKIPEVLAIRCGRALEPDSKWNFFFSLEVESTDKLLAYNDDPIHGKFLSEVIEPHIRSSQSLDFEMEPGKDLRYS
jgi:hypothetical protein